MSTTIPNAEVKENHDALSTTTETLREDDSGTSLRMLGDHHQQLDDRTSVDFSYQCSNDPDAANDVVPPPSSSNPTRDNDIAGNDDNAYSDDETRDSSLLQHSVKTSLSGSVSIVTEGDAYTLASSSRLTSKRGSSQKDSSKKDSLSSTIVSSARLTTQLLSCDSNIPGAAIDGSSGEKARTERRKLNTTSLGVIGRDQEISTLRRCFERLTTLDDDKDADDDSESFCQNELVFISGYSGSGKTSLAETLKEQVSSSNGVYVEGKYAFSSIDEPYTGIARAFGALCNKFNDCPPEVISEIGKTISASMEGEVEMLMGLVPELTIFREDSDTHATSVNNDAENDHERFKYAFRMLTRILGSHFSPVVIVLDDVHWADISSLEILDCLISDRENPRPVMIVGCYRSNEVGENSMLYNRIRTLKGKCNTFHFRMTEIELQNFDIEVVNKVIMTMLSIRSESKCLDLSKVCYKRTLGNPMFLIEFMKMLQAEGILEFRNGIWVWDASEIEKATKSTANVVDLLQAPMRKLPADIQLLLQYAACLGSSFSYSVLRFLWKNHALSILETADPDVVGILDVLQEANLLVSSDGEEFEWVHDKVQEAALSLSDLVTPWFQFGLGVCLYEGLSGPRLEKQLFVVADLINKGNVTERADLAKLNLRAAKKARNMVAFQSAANYVSNGIDQLPIDMWTTHRELTLELHSLGAEMNLTIGNIDMAEEYIQAVLERLEFTSVETMHLKMMKVSIIESVQLRPADAVTYAIQALREVGFKFIWNKRLVPIQVLTLVTKTVKRLEKLPVDHFERARLMEDPRHIGIVDMLVKLTAALYNTNDLFLTFLCICKVIEITIDHGLHVLSAARFSSLAATTMFLKTDHEISSHICDMGFSIQKRFGVQNAAETIHLSYGFVRCYVRPLYEALIPTLDGYSQGLRNGDTEESISCLLVHSMYIPYIMGRPLGSILKKLERIGPQIEESKLTKIIVPFRVGWQMIENLQLPPSADSKKLDGDKYSYLSEAYSGVPMRHANDNFATGELLLFFADHEARVELLMGKEKGKSYAEQIQGYFVGRIETFHRGIAWFAMARRTRKRKYKSEALKVMKQVSKWVNAGDPNVLHYDLMLQAEYAALSKKYEKADDLYKQAISHAVRNDHLHHAALFHERFAEYRLELRNDRKDGKYHLEKAIRYYTEWGAVGKAEHLKADLAKI